MITIQQLLLDINNTYSVQENNTTNFNLPIETPEALEEFNKLLTQDSISLLQYVSILSIKFKKLKYVSLYVYLN